MTLKPKNRKPPELGPVVQVESVRLSNPDENAQLTPLINGAGLKDIDRDGLLEHDTDPAHMWLGACTPGLQLQFDLPQPVALAAIEVWNFNAEFDTANGIRHADVAVSVDGSTWQTVLTGAEFAEAEGTTDYDTPVVLKLGGAMACKVRFQNIVPWNTCGKVGLSAVLFHQVPQVSRRADAK